MREDLHGDVNPRPLPPPAIRRCTQADVAWMAGVAHRRYPGEFDLKSAVAWAAQQVNNPQMVFIRGDRSFGVAHLARRFNAPSRVQAYLTLLYAEPGTTLPLEPFRVVEALVAWAREQGATKFWLSDISGCDLGPFAKRLGGREAGHTYVIDLDDEGTRYG